MEQVTVTRIRC